MTKPTMSFLKPRSTDARCVQLPPGRNVRDVANACRSAALAFAWCARAWQKRDLARWLVGPYATAIALTNGIAITRPRPRSGAPASGVFGRSRNRDHDVLAEETIRSLLDRSHRDVLSLLRSVQAWKGEAGFAKTMVDAGLVIGVMDHHDDSAGLGLGLGFAPVAIDEMRLVDRVRSLFVADYLTRPADYASFRVCNACEGATFDPDHGECQRSVLEIDTEADAGVRCTTLVGLGEFAA